MTIGGVTVVILAVGVVSTTGQAQYVGARLVFRGSANKRPTKRGCHQKQNKYSTPFRVSLIGGEVTLPKKRTFFRAGSAPVTRIDVCTFYLIIFKSTRHHKLFAKIPNFGTA